MLYISILLVIMILFGLWCWQPLLMHKAKKAKNWELIEVDRVVHVLPRNDNIKHELTDACVCGTANEPIKCSDGSIGWVITHQALDGRE